MKLDEIRSPATLSEVLLAEDRGVVLDFWGTWCQPCRAIRPHIEQLADVHAGAWRIVSVHAEANPDLVEEWAVQSTPTFVFLQQGEEVHRTTGPVTPSTIATALGELAA